MTQKESLELIKKEYEFQESESLLQTSDKIFEAFEKKFQRIIELVQFEPTKKILMHKGLDYLNENNYSAVEIRSVEGCFPIFKKDHTEMTQEESIEFLKSIIDEWQEKTKSTMSNISNSFRN